MKKLLDIAMDIGEQMLMSGAEVHRVEDTISRICKAFGASRVDVFFITSSMVATIHDKDGLPYTQTRRLFNVGTDFTTLSKLNALSRKICSSTNISIEEIESELNLIKNDKRYPFYVEGIFYALIAWAFTLFFGGNVIESIISAVIGYGVKVVTVFIDKLIQNKIFCKFISSFLLTALAYLFYCVKIIPSVDFVIIGNIMTLIPGVNLTNSLRDLFTGDSMTGVLRFIEALLTALAIALGYVVLVFLIGGKPLSVGIAAYDGATFYAIQIITAIIGSIGFGLIYNLRGRNLIAIGVGGGIAWALHLLIFHLFSNETVSYFIVSLFISIYSEMMARLLKAPTTVFVTPSLIPLVPGASLYYTMRSMFGSNLLSFTESAVLTLKLSAALALGVIVSTAIMKIVYTIINNVRRKHGIR